MNPIVALAAVDALISPRVSGDACSVVYTMEPVNSPPEREALDEPHQARSRTGAASPICS
jgi:hypothetical protein